MNPHNTLARTFGVFFILTFVSYGAGSALIDSIINSPQGLLNVYENKTAFVIGIILMTLIHTVFNIGLAIIVLPIIKPYNPYCAYAYLSFAIMATLVLSMGAILLLLILPLSEEYASTSFSSLSSIELMANLLTKGGFYAYHLAMSLWGIGSLMFTFALFQSRLIPRFMSAWGMTGYLVLIAGSISQLFTPNDDIEIYSVIVGASFEITLSLWLIVKGFNQGELNTDVGLAHE